MATSAISPDRPDHTWISFELTNLKPKKYIVICQLVVSSCTMHLGINSNGLNLANVTWSNDPETFQNDTNLFFCAGDGEFTQITAEGSSHVVTVSTDGKLYYRTGKIKWKPWHFLSIRICRKKFRQLIFKFSSGTFFWIMIPKSRALRPIESCFTPLSI